MKIITSVFGNKYASLLLVFLESLSDTHPNYSAIIFWSDMDQDIIDPIISFYQDKVTFIEVNPEVNIDNSSNSAYFSSLKSGKMHYLNHVYQYLEEGENFLIIDCDTIINKNIEHVFENDFDVAFTPLEGEDYFFPVNTGVIFLKNNEHVRKLTQYMESHVIYLSENQKEHKDSIAIYGGADQAAFCRIINYKSDDRIPKGQVIEDMKTLKLNPKKYNNFGSEEYLDKINIIHLKGSWQTLIFKGRAIRSVESKGLKALTIYKKFMVIYLNGFFKIYKIQNTKNIQNKLGVKVPFYLSKKDNTLSENMFSMGIYDFFERFYRYFFNQKKHQAYRFMESFLFRNYKFWNN